MVKVFLFRKNTFFLILRNRNGEYFTFSALRHLGDLLVVRFSEAAGDASEGVAVAAERDGQADSGLKIYGSEVGHIRCL